MTIAVQRATFARVVAVFLVMVILTVASLAQQPGHTSRSSGYRPKAGYVPDSESAIKIAEAVLVPVYGEKQIRSEEPFVAELKGDVWTVGGTLRCPDGKGGFTTDCDGGTAVVKLSKTDGRVLFMLHYK